MKQQANRNKNEISKQTDIRMKQQTDRHKNEATNRQI